MIGRVARTLAAGLVLTGAAAAQTPPVAPAERPPGAESSRYSFAPIEGGVMRLDTRTGAMSHCARRAAGWACEAVPDDRSAFDTEIGRLAAENERLTARVAELEKRLDAARVGPPPIPPTDVPNVARPPDGRPPLGRDLPSDAEIDQMMGFVEKLFRRFLGMVETLRPTPAPKPGPETTPDKT